MELSRQALIDRIQSKVTTIEDFNFDNLTAPPLSMLLSQQDIDNLYYIATSVKYSGNPKKKYDAMDAIMKSRGFVKASAGTNRVVYRHLESNDFVVKVAADAVGIHDNPKEFQNQFIFKPFVTKVFEVSPCGTVGVFERVNPIESREEFLSVADDIYDVITEWFIGKYIMADIGTKFFMNWGIRNYSVGREGSVAFGPVLLDFPYAYELDGNKLFCTAVDHNNLETGVCGGVIDYDDGFNFLKCSKCGVRYRVKELAKKISNNEIRINRRETKRTMVIGRYDKDGNIVVDDQVVTKPEEKKVTVTEDKGKPKGTLTIDLSGWNAYKESRPKEEQPKAQQPQKPVQNNSLRTNPGANRGMVKAPAASNIKVDLAGGKKEAAVDNSAELESMRKKIDDLNMRLANYNAEIEKYKSQLNEKDLEITNLKKDAENVTPVVAPVEDNREYTELKEYNAEHDIIVISNGDKEITAKLSTVIPKDYLQTAIESSAEYTEMLAVMAKNKELEEEIDKVRTASDDNYEELSNALKDKDAEIEELKKQLADNSGKPLAIPTKINPDHENDSIDQGYYGDAVVLQGIIEGINGFTTPEIPNDRHVIVFPLDIDECEYNTDPNGNIIAVAQINGYYIDELIALAEEKKSEEASTEEAAEEVTEEK